MLTKSWRGIDEFFPLKQTQISLQTESKNIGDALTHTCSLMLSDELFFFFWKCAHKEPNTNTAIRRHLPEAGLMALHPLVARPRPRWVTSDSELCREQEIKLTVRCCPGKLGNMENNTLWWKGIQSTRKDNNYNISN